MTNREFVQDIVETEMLTALESVDIDGAVNQLDSGEKAGDVARRLRDWDHDSRLEQRAENMEAARFEEMAHSSGR